MLEIKNLCKSFEDKSVFSGFSLQLAQGERLCITGTSGRGKTTLLRLICGLEMPDSGEVCIPRDTRFGMVFQEDRLLPDLSAVGNVKLVSSASPDEIRACLHRMGLSETETPVSTFSGGMKRRVALCRALLFPSDILLLDEPYKGLDEDTRAQVIQECERQIGTRIAVMVSHDINEARGWKILSLDDDGTATLKL